MRRGLWIVAAMALSLALAGAVMAETVHQTVNCDKIRTGDGGNAIEKGKMEAQKVEGADSGQVARMKGSLGQWDYVTCWFGLPAPEGKSIVRFHIYVDGQKTAKCLLYIRGESGQTMVGELKIPADAKEKTFVTVDVPVNAKAEWNGLTIKKAEKSDLPGLWIDTVSVVLPD